MTLRDTLASWVRGVRTLGRRPRGTRAIALSDAERALAAYAAMQREFHTGDGSGLYRDARTQAGAGGYAHLWPFSRALAATIDLAGVAEARSQLDVRAEIADRLGGLERYRRPGEKPLRYESDLVAPLGGGGDVYYDDNAWVGLSLAQHAHMHGDAASRERASELFAFAETGWDNERGGVFWLVQGEGAGRRNHDRNVVSTAPNASLGLLVQAASAAPREMYAWVNGTLDESGDGGGLFWDKLRGDGGIDRTRWSYNQGSMIGLNVLLHRHSSAEGLLVRAETIARRALAYYAGRYLSQPPPFNAILFRNLLLLRSASRDAELARAIAAAIRGYAGFAWERRRDAGDVFRFGAGGRSLIDQAAMVSVYALLAWEERHFAKLA